MKQPSAINPGVVFTASSKVKSAGSGAIVRSKYSIDPNTKLLKDYQLLTNTSTSNFSYCNVAYGGGFYVATAHYSNNNTAYTSDLINWYEGASAGVSGGLDTPDIFYHKPSSRFIIVNTGDITTNTPFRWSSDHGQTWNSCAPITTANGQQWRAQQDIKTGRIVAIQVGSTQSYYSDDGMSSWQVGGTLPYYLTSSILCFKGVWYIIKGDIQYACYIMYSKDNGVTWDSFPSGGYLTQGLLQTSNALYIAEAYGNDRPRVAFAPIYSSVPLNNTNTSACFGDTGARVCRLPNNNFEDAKPWVICPSSSRPVIYTTYNNSRWYLLQTDTDQTMYAGEGVMCFDGSKYIAPHQGYARTVQTWTDIIDKKRTVTY